MAVENWMEAAQAEYRRGQIYKKQRNLIQEELTKLQAAHRELKKAFANLTQENQELRRKINEETKPRGYTPFD